MERISVFDIFKIGIGPSSSHTMGPWKAALRFLGDLEGRGLFDSVARVRVELYGSLAKTGKGHGTDLAVLLGLTGESPAEVEPAVVKSIRQKVHTEKVLSLLGRRPIPFHLEEDLLFHRDESLPFHPNGMSFRYELSAGGGGASTYYSVGGGFTVREDEADAESQRADLPWPVDRAADLVRWCRECQFSIPELVLSNEKAWRSEAEVDTRLFAIWEVMKDSVRRGCSTSGILPGGLGVKRRASELAGRLHPRAASVFNNPSWISELRSPHAPFPGVMKWVSCFALAVNEENASFGRVVTAPTNGAAGVIPAVLLYHLLFCEGSGEQQIIPFLLVAGEMGSIFKKGATISAALGGCQAEIGVSAAMAAAGLTQVLGGTVGQILMAAEIAMEHHLGLTCDPVAGLVQIPCIERNTMGAIKAIAAAYTALEGDPSAAKVSLDDVIKTMKQTAFDMDTRYKETADGGLAVNVPVSLTEC